MSTTTVDLVAERWTEYFDSIADSIEGSTVTIEVISAELGDQVDAERLPLAAIGYDPKDDAVEISLGGRDRRYPVVLWHFIFNPQTISIEESSPLTPEAILVTDASDTKTLIRLYEPAPPPAELEP
jgi:hypothetical protein